MAGAVAGAVVGGALLGATSDERLSIGLCGPSGSGKTLGAASFGGGSAGKIVHINAEFGPEDGAGGATVLKYAGAIHPRLKGWREDVLKLDVRTWQDMQAQFAWLRNNAARLVSEGFRVLILDGGTAVSQMVKFAITQIQPTTLGRGTPTDRNAKIRDLVPNLLGDPTSGMELNDYDTVYDRYLHMHSLMKQLPFRFITTFLEKDVFDEETRRIKIGIGPKLVGKALPAQMPAEVDGFFHCETNAAGEYVWVTRNDPRKPGALSPVVAKHRFGKAISDTVKADGVALLTALGIVLSPGPLSQGSPAVAA